MANDNKKRKYKDRGVADPGIPKAGFTKTRRRLEDGGKATEQFVQNRTALDKDNPNGNISVIVRQYYPILS